MGTHGEHRLLTMWRQRVRANAGCMSYHPRKCAISMLRSRAHCSPTEQGGAATMPLSSNTLA
eukprot:scaffold25703_cov140-Isochrysis_galbana.AAC.3